ncbi:conserved hypothetical protein [Candidatus Caldarchaeum subterraneum]|uniref:Type II toxin-antitoxin system RelE/ParE family toxin n=1 Tax=Caldiarchaeum subterraneum TaxID=311458 RepID=E6P929_CALS0|nr:conserved hypothetical protein [Candidatus Caldarchaeum subterraneum]
MLFQVIISNRARKSLKSLVKQHRRRVLELLLILRENPVPTDYFDVKKLKGLIYTYRVRIGDIRIIYEVSWNAKTIKILLIEWRERAY